LPIHKTFLVFSSILFFIQKLILAFVFQTIPFSLAICFGNYGISFGKRINISLNDAGME